MIEIYLLEQLAAVAKYGTLLKASEELHLSQPALSRSMKKLEEQLGVSLFERENSKISLNKTGLHAVEYAKRILDLDREMYESVNDYDRRQRTVGVGSSAPYPLGELIPMVQERFVGMAITSELSDDVKLINGLKNKLYQLAILHEYTNDPDLYLQHYLEERLYISLPKDHPLARQKSVTFAELRGMSILLMNSVGFWMDVCLKHLDPANMLIQKNSDALYELIEASNLPHFNSDRMLDRHGYDPGRVSLPISDDDAHTAFYIACLNSEKKKYGAVFSAAREAVLRGM
ncbi:MAG: LysR family transcriptional regulator [Clostridia bacterium]|nr:LysR family transcriptional regulator [Clostridia bacterium]